MCEIVCDFAMCEVEPAVGAQAIAFLGYGRRHQGDAWIGEPIGHRCWRLWRNQQLFDRAYDARVGLHIEYGKRVEPILRRERIAHGGAVQRDLCDAPARIAGECSVEVARLMRAMERAGAEVHDASFNTITIVRGHPDATRRQRAQLCLLQPSCGYQFHIVPSASRATGKDAERYGNLAASRSSMSTP